MPRKKNDPLAAAVAKYSWQFTRHLRSNGFGWKGSALACKRIAEAVKEIHTVAKTGPDLAASGVTVFFEKCWRALEHVDSSSGSLGNAVNTAIEALGSLFGSLDIPETLREKQLERIWSAMQEEDCGYYDLLGNHWAEMCATPASINHWADRFVPIVSHVFSDPAPGAFFKGTSACLACLVAAERYSEVDELLQLKRTDFFPYRQYGIRALARQGKLDEALAQCDKYANDPYAGNQPVWLAEQLLLEAGRSEQAYERCALITCMRPTGVATFNAIRKKYPDINPPRIIADLIASAPENSGRYFAAARKARLTQLALKIAESAPVEPRTLTTASKETLESEPATALEYGLLAILRLAQGHGYETTPVDIVMAYDATMQAAKCLNQVAAVKSTLLKILQNDCSPRQLVSATLSPPISRLTIQPTSNITEPYLSAPTAPDEHQAKILPFRKPANRQ